MQFCILETWKLREVRNLPGLWQGWAQIRTHSLKSHYCLNLYGLNIYLQPFLDTQLRQSVSFTVKPLFLLSGLIIITRCLEFWLKKKKKVCKDIIGVNNPYLGKYVYLNNGYSFASRFNQASINYLQWRRGNLTSVFKSL